jgi:CO dehydrogenase/acetyl-CoA synthase delta subunit
MPIEIPKDKWPGSVKTITLGASSDGGTRTSVVTVGGEKALPFMHFEAEMPQRPVVAIEIKDRKPDDWSPLLPEVWGDAMNDPTAWAKAAEAAGADLLLMTLSMTAADGSDNTPEKAVAAVKAVLCAVGLPLIVLGPVMPNLIIRCWCLSPRRPKASASHWASARTRTIAPSSPRRWRMVISCGARRWTSTLPSN